MLAGFNARAAAPLLIPAWRAPAVYLAVTIVVVLNPFLWPYHDRFVTGQVDNRLWWALPLMLALALAWSTRTWIARSAGMLLLPESIAAT